MRFLIFLIIIFPSTLYATDYYANPSGNSYMADGSINHPFKSIAQIQNILWNIQPGDRILLKRGEIFSGHLLIQKSGTKTKPITIGTYGIGNRPKLIYDFNVSGTSPEDRWTIQVYYSKYIIIENIEISDPTMDSLNHSKMANAGTGVYFDHSSYCIARDLKITGVGTGVASGGDYNQIYNCTLSHLRMMKNTAAQNGKFGDDDYGAIAILLYASSHCNIQNNYCEDNWGSSSDYGTDGGGIEIYAGICDSNNIQYNSFINCNGMCELGGENGSACDNIIAYNKIINCSSLFGIHLPGSSSFPMDVKRIQFYNNIVIETTLQMNKPTCLISVDGTTETTTVLSMKNNIFYLLTNVNMNATCTLLKDKLTHENNIYRFNGGITGYPIHNSELVTSATIFKDVSNNNPILWNYHLAAGSPAIAFGKDVKLKKDFEGATVATKPNAGIFETVK